MEFNDHTIILRVGSFKEADLWVRLLSASRGVFSAFAFGGSKSRKRFSGCLDLFNEVLFSIKSDKQGDYLTLQEGVLLKGPQRLRTDWMRLGMAVNCSLFVEAFCLDREHAQKTHALFSSLLHLLEHAESLSTSLPLFFRLRLAFEQGYALSLDGCPNCGRSWGEVQGAVLMQPEGGLLCRSCAPAYGRRLNLGEESLILLQSLLQEDLGAWSLDSFNPAVQQECARAADIFLQTSTGLAWDKGRFRRV